MGCRGCLRKNRFPSAARKKTKKRFRTFASLNKLGGNQDFEKHMGFVDGMNMWLTPQKLESIFMNYGEHISILS